MCQSCAIQLLDGSWQAFQQSNYRVFIRSSEYKIADIQAICLKVEAPMAGIYVVDTKGFWEPTTFTPHRA